ncbi:MAG: hypothetical protein AB1414_15590 [bacterium]
MNRPVISLSLRPLRNLPLRSLRLNLYTFKKLEHRVTTSTFQVYVPQGNASVKTNFGSDVFILHSLPKPDR